MRLANGEMIYMGGFLAARLSGILSLFIFILSGLEMIFHHTINFNQCVHPYKLLPYTFLQLFPKNLFHLRVPYFKDRLQCVLKKKVVVNIWKHYLDLIILWGVFLISK